MKPLLWLQATFLSSFMSRLFSLSFSFTEGFNTRITAFHLTSYSCHHSWWLQQTCGWFLQHYNFSVSCILISTHLQSLSHCHILKILSPRTYPLQPFDSDLNFCPHPLLRTTFSLSSSQLVSPLPSLESLALETSFFSAFPAPAFTCILIQFRCPGLLLHFPSIFSLTSNSPSILSARKNIPVSIRNSCCKWWKLLWLIRSERNVLERYSVAYEIGWKTGEWSSENRLASREVLQRTCVQGQATGTSGWGADTEAASRTDIALRTVLPQHTNSDTDGLAKPCCGHKRLLNCVPLYHFLKIQRLRWEHMLRCFKQSHSGFKNGR